MLERISGSDFQKSEFQGHTADLTELRTGEMGQKAGAGSTFIDTQTGAVYIKCNGDWDEI